MKSEANIRIWGGDDDSVSVAPLGTTLPVGLTPLAAPFKDVGFLDESGIEDSITEESVEVRVHQGYRIARTKTTGRKLSKKIICTEENAVVLGLRDPGATVTTAAGVTTRKGIHKSKSDPRVWVFDTYDESTSDEIQRREVWSRGEVTERGAVSRTANGASLYEFTVTCTGTADEITNAPGVAAAV